MRHTFVTNEQEQKRRRGGRREGEKGERVAASNHRIPWCTILLTLSLIILRTHYHSCFQGNVILKTTHPFILVSDRTISDKNCSGQLLVPAPQRAGDINMQETICDSTTLLSLNYDIFSANSTRNAYVCSPHFKQIKQSQSQTQTRMLNSLKATCKVECPSEYRSWSNNSPVASIRKRSWYTLKKKEPFLICATRTKLTSI